MMVMPLPPGSTSRTPNRAAPPASPRKSNKQPPPPVVTVSGVAFPSGGKSPIKKHLKNAAAAKWPPQSAPTTKTSLSPTASQRADARPTSTLGSMRASIIQVMLGLLDQDQATVEGTISILQTLVALPLENPVTRRECLRLLTTLEQSCSSPSKTSSRPLFDPRFDAASDVPTSEGDNDRLSGAGNSMVPSFVHDLDDGMLWSPARSFSLWSLSSFSSPSSTGSATQARDGKIRSAARDSGRIKSPSLHHCKEFLLACANEIHELDSENPNFDYAEETSSETCGSGAAAATANNVVAHSLVMRTRSRKGWRATEFDYVSTVPSSSCASVVTELDQDDVEADQGSDFSEVLRRADYLSDVGDMDASSDVDDGDDDKSSLASWAEEDSTQQQKARTAILELDNARARVLCRQALHRLRAVACSSKAQRDRRALQLRAFMALKQNGRQSASQRRAFQSIKIHTQQMRLKRLTMKKLRVAVWQRSGMTGVQTDALVQATGVVSPAAALRTNMLVAQHLDLVFVALCAALIHAVAGS